jgi:ketosteroid isomerase-like protein
MVAKVPAAIAEYFAAHNGDDAGRVAACFTEDATVRDEGRDFQGREAIRAWAADTQRKYRFRADLKTVEKAADRAVVTARLSGNFPGSPVDLRYRFRLVGAAIAALEIG